MFNLYSKKKLLLAFEYGLILSQSAAGQKVKLTPEIVKQAEKMIGSEFKNKKLQTLAVEMAPNILSVFNTNPSID